MGDPVTGGVNRAAVFISYAREDVLDADQFVRALTAWGFKPLRDTTDIDAGEVWPERVDQLIRGSSSVILLVSDASSASGPCRREIDLAFELRKLVVPVVFGKTNVAIPFDFLSSVNHIYFYPEPSVSGSGWWDGCEKLQQALTLDLQTRRLLAEVAEKAAKWEREAGES